MESVVDVSGYGCSVRLDTGRLVVESKDGRVRHIAIPDVAVLLLSESAVSVSGAVLAEISKSGGVVVVCDSTHCAVGMLRPIAVHSRHAGVVQGQIRSRPVVRARVWQTLVRAKIRSQSRLLRHRGLPWNDVDVIADEVSRGDKENSEGSAARIYWQRLNLFEKRDRTQPDANRMLNYAYIIIHASVVRALCASGLDPAFGIHHCNPTNPHCLASDMMEPFRTAADRAVADWLAVRPNVSEFSAECRRAILRDVLTSQWKTSKGQEGFFDAVLRTALSLRKCLLENSVDISIPILIERESA